MNARITHARVFVNLIFNTCKHTRRFCRQAITYTQHTQWCTQSVSRTSNALLKHFPLHLRPSIVFLFHRMKATNTISIEIMHKKYIKRKRKNAFAKLQYDALTDIRKQMWQWKYILFCLHLHKGLQHIYIYCYWWVVVHIAIIISVDSQHNLLGSIICRCREFIEDRQSIPIPVSSTMLSLCSWECKPHAHYYSPAHRCNAQPSNNYHIRVFWSNISIMQTSSVGRALISNAIPVADNEMCPD